MIAFPGRIGFFDHARLAEDLRSMPGPMGAAAARGRQLRPSLALLERCGADLLFAQSDDLGARALQRDAALVADLAAQEFGRACDGDVAMSWRAVAYALGRRDLRPHFRAGDSIDLDAMLRWLVLHGIREHGLYALATPRLLRALLRPGRRHPLAPLARLLLAERPDLRPLVTPEPGLPAGLGRWLAEGGAAEYGLHWCLPAALLPAAAPLPPGWEPPAAPPHLPPAPPPGAREAPWHLSLDDAAPLPGCFSERALGREAATGASVHATDLLLRLPRPQSRAAVLLIRGTTAVEAGTLVALLGTRPLGAVPLTPDGPGTVALVLRDLPPGPELVLRLCRAAAAPWPADRPWACWHDLWLFPA